MLDRSRFERGRPDADERVHLAAGVGAELRRARDGAGLTQRRLSELSGVSRRMLQAIEAGERRPRASLLASLGPFLCPEDAEGVTARLVAAAGVSLAAESPHSARRRSKRVDEARRAERRRRAQPRPAVRTTPMSRLSRRLAAAAVLEELRRQRS